MKKLLIIADMEDKCSATPRGLDLAYRLGIPAEVVAFTYESLGSLNLKRDEKATMRKQLLARREASVRSRIDSYSKEGQKVALKAVWDKDLHSWVNKQCGSGGYLAVIKTGRRTESMTHTSLDWQLLRECPVPVLIVARKKWHKARPVLASLDMATKLATKRELNRKVLETAQWLASSLGVELEIITAIDVPVLLADLDLVDPTAFARKAREEMQPQIKALAKTCDLPEKAFHCKRGPVEKVIASRAAKVGAQIVVMGTVGRKGVKARLLGNTAEKVLRHMKTDVLAIRP